MSKKLFCFLALVVVLVMAGNEPASGFDYSPYISDEFILHWPDPTRAYPDIPLDFRFVAYEIHNSPLTWELINEPSGMTIDQDGNVDWTPTTGDIGSYNITVKVTRDAGGFIQRAFTLNVNTTDFIFVSTSGSDSTGDGSLGSPYGTIEHAMRQITNGNGKTIYVRGGTYHEAYAWEAAGVYSPLRAKDFSAADPVEIRSYPGESAILDSDLSGHGLWYYDTSYVIFSNLEAREASNRGGGLFTSSSQHVMIRDSVVRECHWAAANNCTGFMAQGSIDVIFDNCEGYNNDDPGNSHWNSSNFLIYTESDPGGNIYIQNCLSQDTISGFKIKHAGPKKLIVHNCVSIDDNIPYGGASDYSSFRYSVAYNGGGISLGITDPNPYMDGGMLVEHMTIVSDGGVGLSTQDGYLEEGSVIQNNIFYNSSSARVMQFWQWTEDMSSFNVSSDKNVFYSTSEVGLVRYGHVDYSFSGWKGLGYDLNSLFADPLFNDMQNGDFNIPLNSPANFGGGEFAGAFAPGGGTPQPPGQASNPSPADSAGDVSVDADLSWTAGSGSTSSDVYFGTDSTPDAGEFQGNQTATTYDPETMANSTTYYWRIDEINGEGTTTGTVWSFTTEAAAQPPGQASNPSPSNSATDVSITADLSWTAGSNTTSHDVYFGTDSTPDAGEFKGNQTNTTYNPGTMSYSTTYYWRIDEVNAEGTTTGNVWSFTTEVTPPPGQASSPSPANSATDVSIDADLSWTAGSNATSHDVYFGTSSPGAFQGNQTDTTFEPGALSYDVTYYWRIDEINAGGTTTGNVWSFTTEAAPTPPGQASSPSPADSATDVSVAADLSWTAGTNSTSSDVYFGTTSPGTFQGNQTATTFDAGTMDYDTTYYWRIDEINLGGTTTGNVWSFTTAAAPTYECDNWQSLHPEWIFCDDFEDGTPVTGTGSYFEYNNDSGEFVAVAGVGVDNSLGMRVIWQVSETDAGNLKLGFGKNPSGYMDKGNRNTEDFREVYYRIYLKMQDGWTGNPAKLTRAMVIAASDWSEAAIAHHWNGSTYTLKVEPVSCVDASSQVMCVGYNDFDSFEWIGSQDGITPIFDSDHDDIWHCIEVHVKLNDPGQANGIHEAWIDSVLDARSDNLDFVTSYTDYAINAIFVENFWNAGSPQLQERYMDNFVVSTQPIGEWSPGPQPPGQASNPSPADSATDVAVDADLSWTAGTNSTSSDVYFGTSSPGTFQGNQTATTFDTGTMTNDTTYYWRINEINAEGTTTGTVWSFTTIIAAPGQASSPSPADSAADIAVDADLSWTAGSGAATHDVYFGTSSPGSYQGNQTATTFDTGSMANDTTYYWRIDEVNAGGTTTGTVWSFTTIVSMPAQASSPSPGAGASDIAVDTNLSWSAGSGAASHDVYFGTSSPGSYQGNQAATTFEPGTLANDTTYYWRIDEVNAGGTTTGTVWSFTTIVAAPGQASSPSPANTADDVDINANLSWSAGSGAASHDVYFGTSSPGTFQGNQAATTFEPGTMAYDTTYYWRIDEINAGGTTTGAVWNFTTESAPLPPPGQASSPNPADSAAYVGVGADLSWTAGSNAASRDVYFGTSSPGTFQGNQTAVTFDPGTMDNNTTYYWRIDEINASGTTTGAVWSFTTVTAGGQVIEEFGDATNTDHPGTIEDVYTNAGAPTTNHSTSVQLCVYTWPADTPANTTILKWNLSAIPTDATVTQAKLYLYQFEAVGDASYDVPVHKIINVNPVVSTLNWNTYDGTNSWTAGADGGQGDTAAAEDTQPLDNTINEYKTWTVTNMVADWVAAPSGNYGMLLNSDSVSSVDSHRYFVSTDDNDPSKRPKLIVTYTSGATPPSEASSPTPADTATDVSVDTDLSWTAGSGADSHDVYFGTSSPGAFQGNQTAATFDTGSMSNDTIYYWRIDEVNTAGTTTGAVWNFTTIVAAPGQAANPSPADSATDVGIDTDLSWTAGTGSTSSDVYFGTTSPGTLQGNQTATTFEPGTMGYDTTYYWRIDQINVGGTTTGAVWSFTTEAAPPPLPGQAANPSPADTATDVAVSADLSWTAGSDATSRDVYFGTTSPGTFQGNQTAVTFDPGIMANDTTYYWRIDEINATGTTTGNIWSFTTIVSGGDEIIGWWEMDDAAGGTTVDSSTYGNDGTLVGPPTWTDDGERGWCLDFSGDNNYVTIPNESDYDITGPMTVMAWMKASYVDWRNLSTIIAKGKEDSGGWALQKAGRANSVSFYVDVSGMPWDGIKAGVGIFDNHWHHVAGVYDGSNAYIYIDGGLDSNSVACSGNMATNNWNVYIGENSQTLDGGDIAREWNGLTDDVRIYNYALSQSEVNDIYTGGPTPPGQASNPSPADSATDVAVDADLSWTSGTDSTSSDVYFGTTSPGAFQGNQTATTFDPGTMSNDTTYYWRIDEINEAGTTTGNVWSFTTIVSAPGQASSPSPADSATDVSVDADLSWTAGSGATSRDVYFGTTSPGSFQGNQTATTFDPGTLANDTTYYWRIDEINAAGTTTGAVWSFTTESAGLLPWTDGFESGGLVTGGWNTSGDATVTERSSYTGTYGAEVAAASWMEKAVSTAGFNSIHVKYVRKTKGLDSGEYLYVEYHDGTQWNQLEATQATSWASQDKTCGSTADNNANFKVRFRTNSNKGNEYAAIDDVEITGTSQ